MNRTRVRLHQGWWRLVESFLIMALGATLIAIVGSGHFLRYVRPEMAIPLVVTGGCLIGLALWTIVVTCRRSRADQAAADPESDGDHDGHGQHGEHGHHGGHGPVRSVWLIMVPVLIAAVISPPAIGAQLAQRRGPAQVSAAEAPPLPDVPIPAGGAAGEALGLPMGKYVALAMTAEESELAGRRFTVTGFVVNRPEVDGWYLARVRIRCCAADGVPLLIKVLEAPPQPDDGWLELTGRYLPPERESFGMVARLRFESARPIEEPDNPYVFG